MSIKACLLKDRKRGRQTLKRYFLLLLLITLILTACSSKLSQTEAPEISIKVGNKEVGYAVGLNKWNGAVYDREDTFYTIMKEGSDIEVPYAHLGETIEIVFKGAAPDKYELRDYILREDGFVKYTEKEVVKIPIELVNGKASFELDMNWAALLSSNSKDYEPGGVLRGFRLICSWGENECEYGFVIRTDAMK